MDCEKQPEDIEERGEVQSSHTSDPEEGATFSELNSRCCLRIVHEVISRFDNTKRDLVKSIGFGGLLKIPLHNQINRKLAVWLMSRVDESTQTLVIDGCRRFSFTSEDVKMVFGIPAEGRRVVQIEGARSDSRIDYVRCFLGLQGKEARCVKIAQDILERTYSNPMECNEEAAFKVAFVVFAMAMLLATSAKHDYSNIEFWPALGKPNEIGDYDWSSYVMYRLLVASAKLKSDTKKKIRVPLLSGCTFFLQVLYLDSIDLGGLNMPHSVFPRCQVFTYETVKSMAAADTVRAKGGALVDCQFGAAMPRAAAEVCYTWVRVARTGQRNSSRTTRLFDAATHLVSTLHIREEATTPIYLAMLQHRREVIDLIDEEDVTLMEVIGIIANSYSQGFNYCSPLRGNKRALETAEADLDMRMLHLFYTPLY